MAKVKQKGYHPDISGLARAYKAGTRPTEIVRHSRIPNLCQCSWDMHQDGNNGPYYFILKFYKIGCPAWESGEHQ